VGKFGNPTIADSSEEDTWKAKVRNVPRETLYLYMCYYVYVRTMGVK